MKFPIDVAFVDENNIVQDIIIAMQPKKISPIIKGSKYVIEGKAYSFEKV